MNWMSLSTTDNGTDTSIILLHLTGLFVQETICDSYEWNFLFNMPTYVSLF